MKLRRLVAPLALGVAALLVGAPVAASADDVDPLWYFDQMGVQAVHDAGITGEGVTIAVLDGKINLDLVTLADADIRVRDLGGCSVESTDPTAAAHGSSVTSLLVGNGTSAGGAGPKGIVPSATILYYNTLDECKDDLAIAESVEDALAQGADIISMSGGAAAATPGRRESQYEAVTDALRAGVPVVTALPNGDDPMLATLDAANGVINVSAVDAAGQVQLSMIDEPLANEGVEVAAPGLNVAGVKEVVGLGGWGHAPWSGNSAATPLVAGVLALAKQKWPEATASQLIQSLIRTAGDDADELAWNDTVGYGIVDLPAMIATNPAEYPDENPLFREGQEPSYEDVFPTPAPAPEPATSGGSMTVWLLAGGGAVLALALIAVLTIRSKRRSQQGADHGI